MVTLYMSQKNNPTIITEGSFTLETGVLMLEISLGDYSLIGKTVTAVFSQTAVETATITVSNGLIQLPIVAGLLVAGENRIQLNIREGLTLEQSPIMVFLVMQSIAGTNPAPTYILDTISVKSPPFPLVAAKGDSNGTAGNGTDDTVALQAMLDYCYTNSKTLYFPDGKYRITSAITVRGPITGQSMLYTIIFNDGVGDGIIIQCLFFCDFSNFTVLGTVNSRDGIVNCFAALETPYSLTSWGSYLCFTNVQSCFNGRHGLNHVNSWATTYIHCLFRSNFGLGAWFHGLGNSMNNVKSIATDYCSNGGTNPSTTFNDMCGGIRIEVCNGIHFIGGVIEMNNAWGVIITGTSYKALPTFTNIWTESNGLLADVGGTFYVEGTLIYEMVIRDSFLVYGTSKVGATNYLYYVAPNVPNNRFYVTHSTEAVAAGYTYIKEYRPYLRDISKVNTFSGMVSANESVWTKVGQVFIDNYITFNKIVSSGEITVELVKAFWTAAEISSNSASPTTIATAYTWNLLAYKDAGNFLYVKWNVGAYSYPCYYNVSFA